MNLTIIAKKNSGLEMKKKLDRIKIDPKVCLGQPTIRGMRITVAFVLKLMASAMTNDEILQAYPELELGDLIQVAECGAGMN